MKIKTDTALLASAQKASGIESKKEVVENALKTYIRLNSKEPVIRKKV